MAFKIIVQTKGMYNMEKICRGRMSSERLNSDNFIILGMFRLRIYLKWLNKITFIIQLDIFVVEIQCDFSYSVGAGRNN